MKDSWFERILITTGFFRRDTESFEQFFGWIELVKIHKQMIALNLFSAKKKNNDSFFEKLTPYY